MKHFQLVVWFSTSLLHARHSEFISRSPDAPVSDIQPVSTQPACLPADAETSSTWRVAWKDFCNCGGMRTVFAYLFFLFLLSCEFVISKDKESVDTTLSVVDTSSLKPDNTNIEEPAAPAYNYNAESQTINTGNTNPGEIVVYAKTLVDVPYKYASVDPHVGFDCSGFITYVFNHFNIAVPRSSKDFTNIKREIPVEQAKAGDIILFTGTDSTNPVVGHMGIIIGKENNELQFIHSSSGKANGVVITPLQDYYMSRFVKVIRIFKQNDGG